MPDALPALSTTAVIIATGESLTDADVDAAWRSGRRIYAVNDAYRKIPCADVLYAADLEWGDLHESTSRTVGERWTCNDEAAKKYGLLHITCRHHTRAKKYFDASGHGVLSGGHGMHGGNSGFQALNLAFAQGVRDAVLLGFDLGGTHFFGDHPPSIAKTSPFEAWRSGWRAAAPEIAAAGMVGRNATRGGRRDCLPRDRKGKRLNDK